MIDFTKPLKIAGSNRRVNYVGELEAAVSYCHLIEASKGDDYPDIYHVNDQGSILEKAGHIIINVPKLNFDKELVLVDLTSDSLTNFETKVEYMGKIEFRGEHCNLQRFEHLVSTNFYGTDAGYPKYVLCDQYGNIEHLDSMHYRIRNR